MLNRNLQGKPVFVYGDGKQTRCFSYIDDCIQCLEKMTLDPNVVNEIINIGPDEGTIDINKLAELVGKETNCELKPIHMEDRPREVKHAMCSADKARKLLDYETTTTIEVAVSRTADYIRKRGTKPFDYTFPLEIVNDATPKTWKDRLM